MIKKHADMQLDEATPWERVDGEVNDVCDAFATYLKLGPTRSLIRAHRAARQAYEEASKEEASKKDERHPATLPFSEWQAWYSGFYWGERAAEYDAQVAEQEIARIADMLRRRITERLELESIMGDRLRAIAVTRGVGIRAPGENRGAESRQDDYPRSCPGVPGAQQRTASPPC